MIPAPRHPSPEMIVQAVCRACDVSEHEFFQLSRGTQRVVTARTLAVGIARARTRMSYPDIQAAVLGRPGAHSTAYTMDRRFDEAMATPAFRAEAERIIDVALENDENSRARAAVCS